MPDMAFVIDAPGSDRISLCVRGEHMGVFAAAAVPLQC